MIWEKEFDLNNVHEVCGKLVSAWKRPDEKVFVLRSQVDFRAVKNIDLVIRDFYQSLFHHLGTAREFAEDVNKGGRDNQRTGDVWMEVRYDPNFPDAYRHSSNAQPLHTDGAYIPSYTNSTLLACVHNTDAGGETTFLDLPELISSLRKEDPELLNRLKTEIVPHARSGDERVSTILTGADGMEKIYWNYYCVSKSASTEAAILAKDFFDYLSSSQNVLDKTRAIKLQRGDAVMWKDDELLHGRNSFVATNVSERFIWKCALDVGIF